MADPEERQPPAGRLHGRRGGAARGARRRRWRVLSRDERELIALKFEAGLANGDIGTVLGISESNVGTRLSRVVAKLRAAME